MSEQTYQLFDAYFETQCSGCGKPIRRTMNHYRKSKTKKFFCSRQCGRKNRMAPITEVDPLIRKMTDKPMKLFRLKYFRVRLRAMIAIDPSLKCAICGCDDIRVLEINHKLGGGSKETNGKYEGRPVKWYWSIINGERSKDDLDLRCRVCNAVHFLEVVKGIKGYTVTYSKPQTVPNS